MDKRRKPNPAERRRDLCDGATSFYFRTRSALLRAVAERLAELDLASLQSVADGSGGHGTGPSPSGLSQVVFQAGSEPQLSRTKARYELTMQATRDPALAAILQQATDGFAKLHREILVAIMPHGAELEPAVVEDLSNVTLTFLNGLLLRFAHGDRIIDSPEQLDGILAAIATGILKSSDKGRLTKGGGPRPTRRKVAASG